MREMELPSWAKEAGPFAAMIFVEAGEVVMKILYKKALNKGISAFVYAAYHNILGVLILLPYFLYQNCRRSREKRPPITLRLICRFFILGLVGKCLGMFRYVGTDYSNPTLSAALANLTPIFTFVLAIIFRIEDVDLRRPSSLAKSVGTIFAVSGAFIITLYKGPSIFSDKSSPSLPRRLLLSPQSKWILGGLFLSIGFFFSAFWNVLQAETVKLYPLKVNVVFFFILFGTIQLSIVSVCFERNLSAWTLHHSIEITSVAYSAIFGTAVRYNVMTWCLNRKGPLYVALFKPLGMVIQEMAGILFLSDVLYLGSVIGAILIALGFYTVLWGQTKENEKAAEDDLGSESLTPNVPLLQNDDSQET